MVRLQDIKLVRNIALIDDITKNLNKSINMKCVNKMDID